jgi:tetratricopeptide (TPR) repeat protein
MSVELYESLSNQAEQAVIEGHLSQAVELLEQAERAAGRGRAQLADTAFCRRCYVLLELDQLDGEADLGRLKRILLRSTDPTVRWMAAYYSAWWYLSAGNRDKAASYGERALSIAEEAGDSSRAAVATNLFGTLALQASRFDEAEQAYTRALGTYEGEDDYGRLMKAQLLDNLGYVLLCTDRVDDGVDLCEQAYLELEAIETSEWLHQVLQDLCYGYVLQDRLGEAQRCGEQGRDLALKAEDRLVAKNTLFLLAEIAVRQGDQFRARRYLGELTEYYPEIPHSEEMIDVLLGADFTQVVNLRG